MKSKPVTTKANGLLYTILICASPIPCIAADTYWQHDTVTPGDWFEANNWTNGVPTSGSYTFVNNGGTAVISLRDAEAAHLEVNGVQQTSNILMESGSLTTWEDTSVGKDGSGRFTQTGGLHQTQDDFWIAEEYSSSGEYLMTNGQFQTRYLWVGMRGTGTFIQEDGRVKIGTRLRIGEADLAVGKYELRGGHLDCSVSSSEPDGVVLGYFGKADFVQTGGIHQVHGGNMSVGIWEGTGTYKLSGTGHLQVDTDLHLARYQNAYGYFIQTGGSASVGGAVHIGQYGHGSAHGACRISGGTLQAGAIIVGDIGSGTFQVQGAGPTVSAGSYRQSADSILVSQIGANGISTIQITGMAELGGEWTVEEQGAPFGRFDILIAEEGITRSFAVINLPSEEWSWGIENSRTLWAYHVPEPATLVLLGFGGLALLRRKRG